MNNIAMIEKIALSKIQIFNWSNIYVVNMTIY
jgi:hypothetical protein